jgi:hypothetical protein
VSGRAGTGFQKTEILARSLIRSQGLNGFYGFRFDVDAKDLRVLRLPGIAFGKPLSAQNIARHWLGERAGEPTRHYSPLCSKKCRVRSLICSYGLA